MNFKIKYRFYSEDEGGRKKLPYQGYRSDFFYNEKAFMIWPRFEDKEGNLIEDGTEVLENGIARMIIINPAFEQYHSENLKIGTKCFLIEGLRKVAECEVIEIN
jgi:hypothetical protein